jgi:hypothetical protein
VRAAMRQWVHMIERRQIELELRGTIHTAPPTVSHGGAFDRSFLMSGGNLPSPARYARGAWESNTVKVPTS